MRKEGSENPRSPGGNSGGIAPAELRLSSRLLTADDMADMLSVPRRTVYSLVDQGHLRALRVGSRLLRFHPADVAEFLERAREDEQW